MGGGVSATRRGERWVYRGVGGGDGALLVIGR